MKKRILAFILVAIGLSCATDPDEKLVRSFIDAYYVMANHDQALNLTQGQAREQILKEKELLKGVEANAEVNSYKSRDVLFALQKQSKTEDEAIFLYEIKILVPGLSETKQLVNLIVDRKNQRIKAFIALK